MRAVLNLVTVRQELREYMVDLVRQTRQEDSILVGAGPRATQAILLSSRAHAAISGRDFVTPDDVKAVALPVLEHRLLLRPESEIEGVTVAEVIERVLQRVAVPR
jgi:MoxR-like ATPase